MAAYREQDICIGINEGKNIYDRYDLAEYMVAIFKYYSKLINSLKEIIEYMKK